MIGRNSLKTGLPIIVSLVALACILFVVVRELSDVSAAQKDFAGDTNRIVPGPVLYRRVAVVPLAVEQPRGIAAGPQGRLFLCSETDLLEIDETGAILERTPLPGRAQCLAYDGDKMLYIGLARSVAGFHLDTGAIDLWSDFDERAIITSITVSGSWVYVSDAGNAVLYRCDRRGKLEARLEGFRVPSPYLDAVGRTDGSVWITDPGRHTLNLYAPSGELLSVWSAHSGDIGGFSGCCNPIHVALLPDGSLVTSEKGSPWIKVFSAEGRFLGIVADQQDFVAFEEPEVMVDSRGRILALLPREGKLSIYERNQ